MNYLENFINYISWFIIFFKENVKTHITKFIFYSLIKSIREYVGIFIFLIPLKLFIVISNPSLISINDNFFLFNSIDNFLLFTLILFFILLISGFLVDFYLHIKLQRLFLNISYDKFEKDINSKYKNKIKNVFYFIFDSTSSLFVILIGFFVILIFEKTFLITLIISINLFFLPFLFKNLKTSMQFQNNLNSKILFRIIFESSFSLTFITIILLYFYSSSFNFLPIFLSFFISRIILRHLSIVFSKHMFFLNEYYKTSS